MVTSTRSSSAGCAAPFPCVIRPLRTHRFECPGPPHRTPSGAAVRLELLAEELVGGHDEPGRRVTQRTEALPVHVVADVGQRGQLVAGGLAALEPVHELRLEVRPLPAGDTLAT